MFLSVPTDFPPVLSECPYVFRATRLKTISTPLSFPVLAPSVYSFDSQAPPSRGPVLNPDPRESNHPDPAVWRWEGRCGRFYGPPPRAKREKHCSILETPLLPPN